MNWNRSEKYGLDSIQANKRFLLDSILHNGLASGEVRHVLRSLFKFFFLVRDTIVFLALSLFLRKVRCRSVCEHTRRASLTSCLRARFSSGVSSFFLSSTRILERGLKDLCTFCIFLFLGFAFSWLGMWQFGCTSHAKSNFIWEELASEKEIGLTFFSWDSNK